MSKTSLLVGSLVCCLLFTNQASASTPDSTAISSKPTWSVLLGTNASIVLPSGPFDGTSYYQMPRPLVAYGFFTEYSRVKMGLTAGVGFLASFKKNWALELNMICQQKGFSDWQTDPLEKVSTGHLNYASAQQLIKRALNEQWSITAGIEESFLFDQRQIFRDNNETLVVDFALLNALGIEINRFDFSFLFGADYAIKAIPLVSRLIVGFGIIPIGGELIFNDELGTPTITVKDRNAFINLSVSYPFSRKT